MRMILVSVALILLIAFLLIACASRSPGEVSTASSVSAIPNGEVVAKESWEIEWESNLKEAKKEGKVVVYSTAPGVIKNVLGPAFKEKFGIPVDDVIGRGAEIATKVLSERRAGLYITDVYVGGSGTLIRQVKPSGALKLLEPILILPEVLDPKAWFGGKHMWVDSQKSILSFLAYPNSAFAINTRLVTAEEIKSYHDLTNPKWKGKIVVNDPTIAGPGSMSFRVLGFRLLDLDFFRELAKLEPMITRDQRLQVEWLAHGKYAIAFGPDSGILEEFQQAGATIRDIVSAEGTYLSAGHGNVSLLNNAPHPRAAQVFINWLLSREGVNLFSRTIGSQGARLDISYEGMDPRRIRQPEAKYWIGAHTEEFQLQEPEMIKHAQEIFGSPVK